MITDDIYVQISTQPHFSLPVQLSTFTPVEPTHAHAHQHTNTLIHIHTIYYVLFFSRPTTFSPLGVILPPFSILLGVTNRILLDHDAMINPILGSILSAIRLPLKQGEQIPYYCSMGAAQALKVEAAAALYPDD